MCFISKVRGLQQIFMGNVVYRHMHKRKLTTVLMLLNIEFIELNNDLSPTLFGYDNKAMKT